MELLKSFLGGGDALQLLNKFIRFMLCSYSVRFVEATVKIKKGTLFDVDKGRAWSPSRASSSCLNVQRPDRIGIEVLVFVEGRKSENPEKNPRSEARANSKLRKHETASMGIEHRSEKWEASTRDRAHHPTVLPLRGRCY